MTALIRSELLKLRTLRSTGFVLLGLLGIVFITLVASLSEAKAPSTPAELRDPILLIGYLSALFLVAMAANASAGEFRHRTISQRFLCNPARGRVLIAKMGTYAVAGAVVAVVMVGLAIGVSDPVLVGKDLSLGLGGNELARMAGGVLIGTTAFAVLGVVVGMVSRNPTTAMVAIFGLLLAELLIGGLIGGPTNYFPFALLQAVLGLTHDTPWGLAALVLGAITVASVVLAWRVFLWRDVT